MTQNAEKPEEARREVQDNEEQGSGEQLTDDGLPKSSVRPDGDSGADKDTGDPGRTPGSAEGVRGFDKTGNQ
jgi:hypothetical protein